MMSLLVSICIVLAEAVVSSVAPLVMRFVDVATREMRESDSPARKTQSLGSTVALALSVAARPART